MGDCLIEWTREIIYGAKATGELASSGGKPIVELFGGKNAQTPGAINVDIRADIQSGIRADATKLPKMGKRGLGKRWEKGGRFI